MTQDSSIWDAYNLLLLGPDIERLRKLFARYELFRRTIDVPGDIVECGVLKGSSLMLFLKLLHIHCHGSNKRVIGFDMFDSFPVSSDLDSMEVAKFVEEAGFTGTSVDTILQFAHNAGVHGKCELIPGDICQTAFEYVQKQPGFRISLLHLDLDLEAPTYAALDAFWPRVVVGGVVILDEYAVSRWSESSAVDQYFSRRNAKIRTIPWSRTPTAYIVKESVDDAP